MNVIWRDFYTYTEVRILRKCLGRIKDPLIFVKRISRETKNSNWLIGFHTRSIHCHFKLRTRALTGDMTNDCLSYCLLQCICWNDPKCVCVNNRSITRTLPIDGSTANKFDSRNIYNGWVDFNIDNCKKNWQTENKY